MSQIKKLDAFTWAYLECMLFASTDAAGKDDITLDRSYDITDISPEALERAIADCAKFQADNADALTDAADTRDACDDEQAGHDFWLTRNGHGAGFWDGDWPDVVGEALTKAAEAFGELWPYVGDDGLIYF